MTRVLLGVLLVAGLVFSVQPAASATSTAANLPACQHFYPGPIPDRPPSPGVGPNPLIGPVDLSGRLVAPGGVSGGIGVDGRITFTFARVPGAQAYRAFRNGQALQWLDDWGQPTLRVTDATPCQGAHYQLLALGDRFGSESLLGQVSTSYRLDGAGRLAPYRIPAGTRMTLTITAYNDVGLTAPGYSSGPGVCAVDARRIPWGTRFTVPGYGSCYAADIGSWISGDIADVWLPGGQADAWGVQVREIVIG